MPKSNSEHDDSNSDNNKNDGLTGLIMISSKWFG